jgi:hypothetical protein
LEAGLRYQSLREAVHDGMLFPQTGFAQSRKNAFKIFLVAVAKVSFRDLDRVAWNLPQDEFYLVRCLFRPFHFTA